MRRGLQLTASISCAIVALALIVVASDWLFWKRYVTLPAKHIVTAIDWYEPREAVPGIETPPLITLAGSEHVISATALDKALSYVKQRPTVAFIVMHAGRIELEFYGAGYSATSVTDSQSMHKSVLGLLIGLAIADGKIGSVDDPIGHYIPEWSADARGAITIRSLLQMSSGLAHPTQSMNPFSSGLQLFMGSDRRARLLRVARQRAPGEVFDYNNVNSELLGLIVERATGLRYAQYLSTRLWQPLGASTAHVWLDHADGIPHTACCLQTTGRDWLRLGALIADNGMVNGRSVVPASWLEQMQRSSPRNANYGFQLWLGRSFTPQRAYTASSRFTVRHSEPFLAADVIYFDGSGGQRVYVVPSRALVIVHTGDATGDWDDAFLPNTLIRGLPESK